MKLSISEFKAGHKKDRDLYKLQDLVSSIKELGLIEPIVINERNEIISGRRRFFACKELKMEKIEVQMYNHTALDQTIAAIDANLMNLPLSSPDFDEALARRKKLFEQKYPETRQYAASKGAEKGVPFTEEVSNVLGITRRSIEYAIARAEKASPQVTAARRAGKLSPTIVNELIRMPKSYQDTLLPVLEGKSVAQVKNLVEISLAKDADFAATRAGKKEDKVIPLQPIISSFHKIKICMEESLKTKVKFAPEDIRPVIAEADEIISLLERFIETYTPVAKPILRKAQHLQAS